MGNADFPIGDAQLDRVTSDLYLAKSQPVSCAGSVSAAVLSPARRNERRVVGGVFAGLVATSRGPLARPSHSCPSVSFFG